MRHPPRQLRRLAAFQPPTLQAPSAPVPLSHLHLAVPPPRARRCRKLFEELSKVGSFEQQSVCKHFLDQVEPTIR